MAIIKFDKSKKRTSYTFKESKPIYYNPKELRGSKKVISQESPATTFGKITNFLVVVFFLIVLGILYLSSQNITVNQAISSVKKSFQFPEPTQKQKKIK